MILDILYIYPKEKDEDVTENIDYKCKYYMCWYLFNVHEYRDIIE